MHDVHAPDRAPENRVLLVQPGRLLRRDEELRAVGVGARVGHADRVRLVMLKRGELVRELGAPNALAASAVAEGIAALFFGGRAVRGDGFLNMQGRGARLPGS